MISEQLTNIATALLKDEGTRNKPYKCPAGKLTIGVGRNIEDNGLREDEIQLMLKNDIKASYRELARDVQGFTNLDDVRQNVLVNMCFNMGWPTLKYFKKMFAAIQDEDYQEAARQMLDSKWAKQVGVRADRLSLQMEQGR